MRHVRRVIRVAFAIATAAGTAALADPTVRRFVDHHPALAGYLTLASSVVYAVVRALGDLRAAAAGAGVASSGSPTMGAK